MYICICEEVTDKQIKSAIERGAQCIRDLRKELGIASQCGQCGRCAKALLKEHCATHCQQQNKQTEFTGKLFSHEPYTLVAE